MDAVPANFGKSVRILMRAWNILDFTVFTGQSMISAISSQERVAMACTALSLNDGKQRRVSSAPGRSPMTERKG